ncbi:DUF222 domain-containing protein [Nocardia sp. NPDC052001]|uniref:HNH endonuclease signature motif containing protein n=1 Tax=Nocardia sp. NPDC052001 TaxID=3154853 RepID=UPI00342418EF
MNAGEKIAIADSVNTLSAAVDSLASLPLIPVSDNDIVELMQQIETATRKLDALKLDLVVQTCSRSLPKRAGAGSVALFLQDTLRISHGDALNRWHCAEQAAIWPRVGDAAEIPAAPVMPNTALAQEEGVIGLDHVRVIRQVMDRLPSKVSVEDRALAEEHLARHARALNPNQLPKIGDRILGHLDPDGTLTNDADRARLRSMRLSPQGFDLMSTMTVVLTPEARAAMDAVLAKLARPGLCNPADPESPFVVDENLDPEVVKAAAERDTRTTVQRQHDALFALLHPDFHPAHLGSHRGLPVTTILTMSITDVERAAGVATTATGGTVPVAVALEMAARKSKTFSVVTDGNAMPLHIGEARLANPAQRMALIATERGCTRPGCTAPASMAAVHHVTEYAKGGPTDIENLTLACDHCHALVNDTPTGWTTIKLGKDSPFAGRTAWIAPAHIDPTRTPKVNHLHHPDELMATAPAAQPLPARPSRACVPTRMRQRPWVLPRPACPARQ